ncbi:hypothetical protein SCALM49S_06734 [Streptomyces californicus]
MRVSIAGAGAVGRSIAAELLENGHEVLLIDKAPTAISVERVPMAEWLLADACEITSLDEAALQRCNVRDRGDRDDKVNLVVSLLAKTEYGVPREDLGEQPEERVAVQRVVGCGRRRVDAAADVGAGRGGGRASAIWSGCCASATATPTWSS